VQKVRLVTAERPASGSVARLRARSHQALAHWHLARVCWMRASCRVRVLPLRLVPEVPLASDLVTRLRAHCCPLPVHSMQLRRRKGQ
jgi:hypothetical protein